MITSTAFLYHPPLEDHNFDYERKRKSRSSNTAGGFIGAIRRLLNKLFGGQRHTHRGIVRLSQTEKKTLGKKVGDWFR